MTATPRGITSFAAYAPAAQAVLAQSKVDAKTDEPKAALELLGILPLKGNLCTGDALFCQRDICAKVIEGGGEYILRVKDNQPGLTRDIAAGWRSRRRKGGNRPPFPPPYEEALPPSHSVAGSVDKGHGRLEKRTIRLTRVLTGHQDFKGLKQGFALTRARTEKGATTVEVVQGITNLSREKAEAKRLRGLVRDHGGRENGSHYRREVTRGEDASGVRKGSAPQVMAALRNTVIHLTQGIGTSLASAVRKLANCFPPALSLLGLPQLE